MPPTTKCPIEYGKLVCLEGKPRIPFFNPNGFKLTNTNVIIPKSDGVDIYSVNEPLEAYTTEVLTLIYHDCPFNLKTEDLKVKWCCDSDCYEVQMFTPSDDLTVMINGTQDNCYGIKI